MMSILISKKIKKKVPYKKIMQKKAFISIYCCVNPCFTKRTILLDGLVSGFISMKKKWIIILWISIYECDEIGNLYEN